MYAYTEHAPERSQIPNPERRVAESPESGLHCCPGCNTPEADLIARLPQVPVNCSTLWPSRTTARHCETGSIELRGCHRCGLVFNARFDAAAVQYDTKYDNSLDFSPAFQTYASHLARHLVSAFHLRQKRIVEIGCGTGTFLKLLCSLGKNSGTGYDPSFPGDSEPAPGVGFVKDYFGFREASQGYDFLCCRHVLEHIEKPLEFLRSLARVSSENAGAGFYFEVPNGEFVLGGGGFWDVIYPHVCYFQEASLRVLFERAGFEVLRTGKTFSDQFLFIEARLSPLGYRGEAKHIPLREIALSDEISSLTAQLERAKREWSGCLHRLSEARKPVAFWGAGAKGVTFLNLVPGARNIANVIDSNPRKQQMFVPGTGQRISAPEILSEFPSSTIVLLNPAYQQEIDSLLASRGITAAIITQPDIPL